jgi:hypothetical protein
MGISPLRNSSCSCCKTNNYNLKCDKEQKNIERNYTILDYYQKTNAIAVKMKFKNFENYEGVKILIFKGKKINHVLEMEFIDPHFCENQKHSPIARFEPTDEGWQCAKMFVSCYDKW